MVHDGKCCRLVNLNKGFYLEEFIKKLSLGYNDYDYKVINTADYGVPQTRKRFIFIANKTEILFLGLNLNFIKNRGIGKNHIEQ